MFVNQNLTLIVKTIYMIEILQIYMIQINDTISFIKHIENYSGGRHARSLLR